MIKVFVSNNGDRQEVVVSSETTIDEVFEKAGIAMGNARPWLNDEPIHGQTHKTLKDFGVGPKAYLSAVANKDNN